MSANTEQFLTLINTKSFVLNYYPSLAVQEIKEQLRTRDGNKLWIQLTWYSVTRAFSVENYNQMCYL